MIKGPKMPTPWNRCAGFTQRRRARDSDPSRRLLLSNAVNSAAAPTQVVERDRHDGSVRVGAPERFDRPGILGDAVGRSDDRAVGEIEIHIGPAVTVLPARYR